MQGLQQSYTQYLNRKHHKVGHLFQGRYKAIVCERDQYLLTLVRYIHLNPIRAKIAKLDEYPYSGHREYCGARANEVLEPSRALEMLGGRAGYRRFVQEGLQDGHQADYYAVVDQRFLGEERFRKAQSSSRRRSRAAKDEEAIERRLRHCCTCRLPGARGAFGSGPQLARIALSSAGRLRIDPAARLQT
jgi:hypothetical protein